MERHAVRLYEDIDWSYFYYELQMVWYYVYDQFVLAFSRL